MGGEKKYKFTAKYSAKTDASTSVNVKIGKDKKSASVPITDRNLLHLYILLLKQTSLCCFAQGATTFLLLAAWLEEDWVQLPRVQTKEKKNEFGTIDFNPSLRSGKCPSTLSKHSPVWKQRDVK